MSFYVVRQGTLEYYCSDILQGSVVHAFTTRYGGVSQGHLSSLNLGVHRGDHPENVVENYRILGNSVGFRAEDTVFAKQVHSDIVAEVGAKDRGWGLFHEVEQPRDGMITRDSDTALVVFGADCTPILLHDPVSGAIGAVHSGWRGTAAGIVKKAVERLQAEYGAKPENIQAAIGPCIGRCCFETGPEVPQAMSDALGSEAEKAYSQTGNNKYHVDLKKLNSIWLRRAGVEQIDICPACTACQPKRFWSYRRVGDLRGSLAAVIMRKGGAKA